MILFINVFGIFIWKIQFNFPFSSIWLVCRLLIGCVEGIFRPNTFSALIRDASVLSMTFDIWQQYLFFFYAFIWVVLTEFSCRFLWIKTKTFWPSHFLIVNEFKKPKQVCNANELSRCQSLLNSYRLNQK